MQDQGFNTHTNAESPFLPCPPLPKSPKVQIQQLTKHKIRLHWTDVDRKFLNALRRTTIRDTPTLAVERVFVMDCSPSIQEVNVFAGVFDLPVLCLDASLLWQDDLFVAHDECIVCNAKKEENTQRAFLQGRNPDFENEHVFCTRCSIRLTIDVACPENETSRIVKGSDVCIVMEEEFANSSLAKKIQIHEEYEIFELFTAQYLKVECILTKSCGRKNIRWQPATPIPQAIFSVALTQPRLSPGLADGLVRSCPKHVFEIETLSIPQSLKTETASSTSQEPTSLSSAMETLSFNTKTKTQTCLVVAKRPLACDMCGECNNFLTQHPNSEQCLVRIQEDKTAGIPYEIEV